MNWCMHAALTLTQDAVIKELQSPRTLEQADTQNLAALFKYECYSRCCMYSDSYITSREWICEQKRDNGWIAFQHYVGPCVPLVVMLPS